MIKFIESDFRDLMFHMSNQSKDMIFIDPPFNNGTDYDVWNDKMDDEEYLKMVDEFFSLASSILKKTGSLFVHVPDTLVADYYGVAMQHGFILQNWIIWHYRFGVNQTKRLTVSKAHCLWLTLEKRCKFCPSAIQEPSDRATMYNDDRSPTGTRIPFDVWGFEKYWGRVQGNNDEKEQLNPNQLPEVYLERLIKMVTEPGDNIFDPCCGSGTTAVVADALGRNCVTCDVSGAYIENAQRRLKRGSVRVKK